MQKNLVFALMLVFLPSCIKYHKIAKSEFPQGEEKEKNKDLVSKSVRSGRAYDKFTTRAIFDALWMSDGVREHYVEVYGKKHGHSKEQSSAMLRRGLEENKHWVSFYLLSYMPESPYATLGDKNSAWSPFMKLSSGEKVAPIKVEEIELAPELQYFFGDRASRFKTAYFIKFPAKPHKDFRLVLSSVDRDVELDWQDKPKEEKKKRRVSVTSKKINDYEDFYWG